MVTAHLSLIRVMDMATGIRATTVVTTVTNRCTFPRFEFHKSMCNSLHGADTEWGASRMAVHGAEELHFQGAGRMVVAQFFLVDSSKAKGLGVPWFQYGGTRKTLHLPTYDSRAAR